jgi:hypothetical protein
LNTPHIFRFAGPVKWVAGPGPAAVTLLGLLTQTAGDTGRAASAAQLSLMCSERPALPDVLMDVTVEVLALSEVVLHSGAQVWHLRCSTWQLHRDVGAAFYAAVPPRATPWTRRFGWRVLLGIAGTGPGRWFLARRSRAKP